MPGLRTRPRNATMQKTYRRDMARQGTYWSIPWLLTTAFQKCSAGTEHSDSQSLSPIPCQNGPTVPFSQAINMTDINSFTMAMHVRIHRNSQRTNRNPKGTIRNPRKGRDSPKRECHKSETQVTPSNTNRDHSPHQYSEIN